MFVHDNYDVISTENVDKLVVDSEVNWLVFGGEVMSVLTINIKE